MNEPAAIPPPETEDEPAPQPPPREQRKQDLLPWLSAAGFLILAAAIVWILLRPIGQPAAPAQNDVQVQAFNALTARVARLEQRTSPQPTDLGPLANRIAALEQRPAGQNPDFARLEARVAALETRQSAQDQLAGRIDALSARADSLETAQRTMQGDLARRLDGDEARLGAIERMTSQISALADRASRVARIQAARLALDAGQKLGDVSGAPPALSRFADAAPPTEAGLRLAFGPASRAALAAARPATTGEPLLRRVWAAAQDLVTVRQGDRVLLGDPAAGVLDRARAALDAGDLASAVAAVEALKGGPAQAMAGWLSDARSLLQARAALADWASHT